jgi:23S rRNA pseudouridine1911/1915/1917 synthase
LSPYLTLRAGGNDQGLRLDAFLARRFDRSRSALRSRLEGQVLSASGEPLKWSHRMKAGETIQVPSVRRPEPKVDVTYQMLLADEWIIAVNKGAGAPVHPTRSWRSRTLLTRLKADLEEPGLKPAHRLDRETSGVLVFGRTKRVVSALMSQFKQGTVRKRYLAVVQGIPRFQSTLVQEPLARDPDFPIQCRMRVDKAHGRQAVTELEMVERGRRTSLVSAVPRTGRQHQIRVHLAHLGHPVLGDKLYQEAGEPYLAQIQDELDAETLNRLGHHRQALHAEKLDLVHPETGVSLRLEAPLPAELASLVD